MYLNKQKTNVSQRLIKSYCSIESVVTEPLPHWSATAFLVYMVPNTRKQAAGFLNRFDLPKVISADQLSIALSDGSLVASLISRYYPDQIDISRLILPSSSVHSKMHNWTVINECLASPLDNGQLLNLATANDEFDAIKDLTERLLQILPEESRPRSSLPTLTPSSPEKNIKSRDHRSKDMKASELLLDAIETCEGTVQYLNEKTNLMTSLLRQLREVRDENDDGNQFDRLLNASNAKRTKTKKLEKKVKKAPTEAEKRIAKCVKVAKSKGIADKSVKRSARQKRKTKQVSSVQEDRIMSLIGRFDALLKEQNPSNLNSFSS